jgi:hypothetical protein
MINLTQCTSITINFKKPWNAKTHYLVIKGDETAPSGFAISIRSDTPVIINQAEPDVNDLSQAQEILKKYKL